MEVCCICGYVVQKLVYLCGVLWKVDVSVMSGSMLVCLWYLMDF